MITNKKKKILIALILILWIQTIFMLGIISVSGDSMNNTLEDGNTYYTKDVEVNKIKRFDIITIALEDQDTDIVKRVVGLPGETIKYENNNLYVDQKLVEQNFNYKKDDSSFEQTLADDEYYVLGDNRPNSLDSRELGPIKYDEIKSIVMLK